MQSNESDDSGATGVHAESSLVAVEAGRGSFVLELHKGPLRLNFGSGSKPFDGWVNIDLDGSGDITCDVLAIPLPDACADEAMACHVIEHIPRWRTQEALREWFRLLKPGGMLVLELPDFVKCCQLVVDGFHDGILAIYGDPTHQNYRMMHCWGFTPAELTKELKATGFRKVREQPPQFHGKRHYRDMRLEAMKP